MKRLTIRSLYLVAMVLALTSVMWWGTGIAPGTPPSVVDAQSKVGDVPPDRRATPSIIKASPLTNNSSSPIAVGSAGGVAPLSPAGPWTVVAPLPSARYGNGGAGDGTFYYSVGGSNITSMLPDVFRYDPVGDTWTSRAPIPTAVQDAPVVFAGGKLYVFGGLNGNTNVVYDTTQIYDIAGNTWSTGAPMPAVRFGSYAGLFNGKIYVAGGFLQNDINTGQNQTWEYNIAGNTWLTKSNMPNVNALGSYAGIGPLLYTFAGWRGNPCCDTDSYQYDMANDVWTTIASLPVGLEGTAAAVDGGKILIYGGGAPFSAQNTTYIYDPGTNMYSTGPTLNQVRVRFAGGNAGSFAIAVAGYTGSNVTNSTERSAVAGASSGLLIGSALTTGYAPNSYGFLASNIVGYSFSNSQAAPNEFAIFQTHDPWGYTIVKTAITGSGHTYTTFTPAQLTGFTFSNYRVVILNWDDTPITDFDPPYISAIPALESYVNNGGVLWVQAAIQGGGSFAMPFGGLENYDLSLSDFIADPASPMVAGAPNPLVGNYASHASYSGLPGGAHIVIKKTDTNGQPVLYDLRGGTSTCTLTCPANITQSNDTDQCGAVVTYPPPTSTGNCGAITCSPASGSFFQVGTTTVTCQSATAPPPSSPDTTLNTGGFNSGGGKAGGNGAGIGAGIGGKGIPTMSSGVIKGVVTSFPASPLAVLYDQTSNPATSATVSQNFETANDAFDNRGADDFVVPPGVNWTVQQVNVSGLYFNGPGPATSVNVTFYSDSATLPGAAAATYTNLAMTDAAGSFTIPLPVAAVLAPGTYWVSVQANLNFSPNGEWGWLDRTVQSNSGAAWENPGGGFGTPCTPNYGRKTTCVPTAAPDNIFQILGTSAAIAGGPTCTFTVTVNDTQPPTIHCPDPIFVAAAASCPPATSLTVNYTVTATDNCPAGLTVVCNPPSGSIFPIGTTTVTCTATDASGNTATCSFTVTVFSACLQDESNSGNVVLFNAQTGEYRFCCSGTLLATGTGVLTIRGCIGSITDQKGSRKVTIGFDFSAFSGVGRGTASLFLNGSTNPKCSIIDQNMANNFCTCPSGGPPSAVQK